MSRTTGKSKPTTYLRPDDYIYVSADELEPAPDGRVIYNGQPASIFGGEGVKIRMVSVEGPLEKSWPPQRTRDLFRGVEWDSTGDGILGFLRAEQGYKPALAESPEEAVRRITSAFASKAFRRAPSDDEELDELVSLAMSSLKSESDFG